MMALKKQLAADDAEVGAVARTTKKSNKASAEKNIPALLVIALVFLLPLFYLPASIATLASAKLFLITVVTAVADALLCVQKYKTEKSVLPITSFAVLGLGIVAVNIVASITSENPAISFFGRDFAQDSLLSMLVLFGLFAVTASVARDTAKAMYVYMAFMVSGFIVVLAQLLNVFIPALPSLGIFATNIATPLGKWNDVGLFAVLLIVVSALALTYVTLAKKARIFSYAVVVLSVILVLLVNFSVAWWLLGLFALVVLAQTFVSGTKAKTAKLSIVALVLFIVSGLGLAFGNSAGAAFSRTLSIQHLEVRPSAEATVTIAQKALSGPKIVVGVGPALFEHVWPSYRPESVTATNFWNTDFRYGFGILPTFVITIGLLGALAWAVFLLALVWLTIRVLRARIEHMQDAFLLTTSAVLTWCTWAIALLYLPSATLFAFAFIFTGLFVGTAARLKLIGTKDRMITVDTTAGKIVLAAILVVTAGVLVVSTTKFVAHTYFQRSVAALVVANDGPRAEQLLSSAVRLDAIDTYYRSLGEVGTARLTAMVTAANNGETVDPNAFRALANTVIQNYEKAISYDPKNYNNQIGLGNFYTSLAALGTDGVYDAAKQLYSKALELKPNNPAVYLAIAQLELVNRNTPAARAAIDKAIEIKPNYTDAYLLLTQLELSQGSRERATNVLRRAGAANPNDPFVYFQLGLLEYDNKNYDESVLALERAVSLNPQFQNAKYFLGLAYYQIGESPSSTRQFEELAAQNPENQDLQLILNNIRAGLPPVEQLRALDSLNNLPLEDDSADAVDETLTEAE